MLRSLFITPVLVCLMALAAPLHAAVPTPPTVNTRGYILLDHVTGRVLAEQNADARMEPASLTKLMTAYVVFKMLQEKRLKLDEPVTISQRAWRTEGSRTFVQVGTQVPVEVLIKGMIVQSGNDATVALAERIGGTEEGFAQIMNDYARKLGMKSSNFENSPGLPGPNHYTTARDMAILARAIINEFPEYYQWYSMREFTWNNITQQNRNGLLVRDASVDGMKTGHTESAGYCLVSSARRDGMRLVSVVMGSPTVKAREDASAALLNYGFTFYQTVKIKGRGEEVLKPRVYKSAGEYTIIGPQRDVYVTVERGLADKLKVQTNVRAPLVAPLPSGAVGELVVTLPEGGVIARAPLVPVQPVEEGSWWTQLMDSVWMWWET